MEVGVVGKWRFFVRWIAKKPSSNESSGDGIIRGKCKVNVLVFPLREVFSVPFHYSSKILAHQIFYCIFVVLRESSNEFGEVLIRFPVGTNIKKITMLDVVAHGHMACKESRLICQRVGSLIPL